MVHAPILLCVPSSPIVGWCVPSTLSGVLFVHDDVVVEVSAEVLLLISSPVG